MGVTITANNSNIDITGGYFGFAAMRCNIANAWDEEFGKHYEKLYGNKGKNWPEVAEKILSNDRFTDGYDDIISFLMASDCNGSISYKTCKKIYDIIKDIDYTGQTIAYGDNNDGEDYTRLKALLKECYSKRRKLRWF